MAILSNGKFYGFLCSAKETGQKLANGVKEYVEDFVSGFAGHGWKIWEYVSGKWMMEVDALRVRGQFTVFELLVSKIRAIIGAQAITQGCGKIKTVEMSEDGTAYLITVEEEDMSFVEHDFIRCQEFSAGQKMYHVEIESVTDGVIRIPKSEFEMDGEGLVMNPPEPGDDIVQFGNSSYDEKYVGRHSAIYMHADESAQPAIDVLDGIYSKDWSNCLKVRMGGDIPGSDGLKGFYCVNGMIKGVDKGGAVTYCLYPDGTAELGGRSALFKPDKSGYIAGGAIAWEWNAVRQKYVCTMKGVVLTWDNLDDETKENLKGRSLSVQYSVDGVSNWHNQFTTGDIYMRQKLGDDSWSEPMQIVGENGAEGAYMDFQFSVSSSSVEAPTTGWQDAPPEVNPGKYLWMRSGWVIPPATKPDSWKSVRIQGNDGQNGSDGSRTELRYKRAFSRPLTPSGINPVDWALSPDALDVIYSHLGDFTNESGYYVSPSSTSHSAIYKDHVSFVTDKNNQVLYMEVSVSSETYDYGIVCALDTTYNESVDTLWKKSGIESDIIEIAIPTAGSHFIEVVYAKDSSTNRNEDKFKFRFVYPQICWLTTAVIGPNTKSPEWSEPLLFPTDTPDNEQIYLLAKSDISADMPFSDAYVNEYIGDAQDYDSTKLYVVGNIVRYNNAYKINISSSTAITPDNVEYWQEVKWWSDNPKGVSAEFPYEYTCNRNFSSGKWGAYGNYHLFMHYGKNGDPGQDANLLPWIEEWSGKGTEIDGEFIVSPKMFSGINTGTSKEPNLTGVALGRDVIMIDGVKKTGLFGIKEGNLTFSVDAETGDASFTGTVNADKGKVGGFEIDGYGLSNFDNKDAFIYIKTDKSWAEGGITKTSKKYAVLGNSIASSAGFETASLFEAIGSGENIAIKVSAKGSEETNFELGYQNIAILATGGVKWFPAQNDIWNMPGVLCVYEVDFQSHKYSRLFGNGMTFVKAPEYINNSELVFTHNIGHTNYTVLTNCFGKQIDNNINPFIGGLSDVNINSFILYFFRTGDAERMYPAKAHIVVVGRN